MSLFLIYQPLAGWGEARIPGPLEERCPPGLLEHWGSLSTMQISRPRPHSRLGWRAQQGFLPFLMETVDHTLGTVGTKSTADLVSVPSPTSSPSYPLPT